MLERRFKIQNDLTHTERRAELRLTRHGDGRSSPCFRHVTLAPGVEGTSPKPPNCPVTAV